MNNQDENPSELLRETRPTRLTRRRRILLWSLGITVLLLLSIIVSQQLWLWTVIPPDTASDTLLLYALSTLNFVAFVVFSFIFVRNLLKLRRERRELQLGSKIKTRLLVYFIAISFLPIIAMAVFSYLFLNRSLEKWFGQIPARVVSEAQEVEREAVDAQARNLRDTASLLAVVIKPQSDIQRQQTLDRIVASGKLSAVEIIDPSGRVIAQSRGTLSATDASELDALLERTRSFKGGYSLADGKDLDAVIVPINELETGPQYLTVVSLRRANSELADSIAGSQGEYRHLVERQRRVRSLGLSTLGLMTLMLLFVSSWVAIYLARGIATPIKALAEASNEIARGNLSHRVTTIAEDELALLAHSFNQMTAQLEDNRSRIEAGSAALREKNQTLEERRDYIETILQSLSTGVVSLDEDDCVTTINAAASRILRLSSVPANDRKLENLLVTEDWSVIDRILRRARRTGQATEQAQLTGASDDAESTPLPVALTATALRASAAQKRGVVLVLEDLSELLSAQRVAAWSEVARRMAHEIKNPLTPIQLSAERIAKSYRRARANGGQDIRNGQNGSSAGTSDETQVSAIIDECTETIAREVAGLKAMVDEFSRFARLPLARLEVADLNEVVRHAVGLYDDRLDDVIVKTNLDANLPAAMLDTEQLRRVFVNLIDNAGNALTDLAGERQINISTSFDLERSLLIAEVSDTGHGIRPGDFKRLFQPYFSTRGSGTGLGLAIVQRIVLEHGGRIRAGVNYPRGARFVIELPVGTDGRPATGDR